METWDRFSIALEPVTRRKQEQKRRLDLHGGGIVECWSCEGHLTSRGRKYRAVAVDEAAHISNLAETWEGEILPCLLDMRGGAWFPSSPNGLGDYHELYQMGQSPDFPEWASWQIDSYANPHLSTQDLNNFKSIMSDARYRQEILAQFVVMEGGCFPDFRRDANVVEIEEDSLLETWVAVDPGYRTFAWMVGQVGPDSLRILQADEWHNCSTEQARDTFKSLEWAQRISALASDPAAASTDIQTGVADLEILRQAFPAARLEYSHNPIDRNPEKRAERIRDYIKTASGEVRLFIHPRCDKLIKSIEGSRYPKVTAGRGEKQEPVKDGINDHSRDMLGYFIVNACPKSTLLCPTDRDVGFGNESKETRPWD
jgi:hypothetical protein